MRTYLTIFFVLLCRWCFCQEDISVHMKNGATYTFNPESVDEINFISYPESNSMDGTHLRETENGYEVVDLGLSVKWATCNIGANSSDDVGKFFFWGSADTKLKPDFWARQPVTNNIINGRLQLMMLYEKGILDYYCDLTREYDTANQLLGGRWRMPTNREGAELFSKCIVEVTTINSVKGYKFTGPNGNSIFIPYSGIMIYGKPYEPADVFYYHTSTCYSTIKGSVGSYLIDFNKPQDGVYGQVYFLDHENWQYPIRPVVDK